MRRSNEGRAEFDQHHLANEAGCWIWGGYLDRNGYGKFYDKSRGTMRWAHRHSYEIHVGPIPDQHQIDHMCQVTACVNPDHLQVVTSAEHIRITMQRLGKDDLHKAASILRRGGHTYGEIAAALSFSHRTSAFFAVRSAIEKGLVDADEVPHVQRLNDDEREEIRFLHELGIPQTVIGRFYEIDPSHVSRVCAGLTSGHKAVAS